MGWEVLTLGLHAAGEAFDRGSFVQHPDLPGTWLERGRIGAADAALMDGAPGLGGHRALNTARFAAGSVLDRPGATRLRKPRVAPAPACRCALTPLRRTRRGWCCARVPTGSSP